MGNFERYLESWGNTLCKLHECEGGTEQALRDRELLKRLVFNSIKVIADAPEPTNREDAEKDYLTHVSITEFVKRMTPKEFMNIFPIEKFYKGHKFGMKDYYSTLEYIKTLELDEPLGENVKMFLMEYSNDDVHDYIIEQIMSLSRLRQFEGHLHLFEEFMASQGHDTLNTFKNSKNEPMYVRNGEIMKIETNNKIHLTLM